MKKCSICKELKSLDEFYGDLYTNDNLRHECKECSKESAKKSRRTKRGIVGSIYGHQKYHSKTRGHVPPNYSKEELWQWLNNDQNRKVFNEIYERWRENDYYFRLTPSVDRLIDSDPYTIENIRIVTWEENNQKGIQDMRDGKIKVTSNPQKAVKATNMITGKNTEFVSVQSASRSLSIPAPNISKACNGIRNNAGGYTWTFI